MKLSVPGLLPLLPLLSGCILTIGGEGDDEIAGDGDGDADSSSTSSTAGTSESSTDDDVGTDSSSDAATDSSTDTGPEELCGLSEGPAEPWITLSQADMAIVQDSPVSLECGGQGSFMIRFGVAMGGFMPADPDVPVHVVLDVEGFNLGANGHFAEFDYTVFVGCCSEDYNSPDYCYYDPLLVTLFPPDQIPDLEVLHQLPATLTVTLTTGGEPVEQVIPVQMWAVPDESWDFCSYGYYGTGFGDTGYGTTGTGGLIEELELAGLPIPVD
ncbi:hypothetical protein ACNOYE_23935 [Nannocystaceae bacterium ST9]